MRNAPHESAIASGFGLCVALRGDAPSGFRRCCLCSMRIGTGVRTRDWLRALWGPSRRRSQPVRTLSALLRRSPCKGLISVERCGGESESVANGFGPPLLCIPMRGSDSSTLRQIPGTSARRPHAEVRRDSFSTSAMDARLRRGAVPRFSATEGGRRFADGTEGPVGWHEVGFMPTPPNGRSPYRIQSRSTSLYGLPTVSSFWFREDGIAKLPRGKPRVTRPDRPSYYRPTERKRSRLGANWPPSRFFPPGAPDRSTCGATRGNHLFVDDVVYLETANNETQKSCGVYRLSTSCHRLSTSIRSIAVSRCTAIVTAY